MTQESRGGSSVWANHPLLTDDARRSTAQSDLIRAYRGQAPSRRPVWFMRQAGRSLPEYRRLREGTTMLDACVNPELASEITLQPVRRHDVDAAIFFSDIVIPLRLAGIGVEIQPGVGPVLEKPVRTAQDVAALPDLDQLGPEIFAPIAEAVQRTVAELGPRPLIGFAGAPFTVAAYMVEGKPSRDHLGPRAMMHREPETWEALMRWAAHASGLFLAAQVRAGASAVQLFDSWAGSLSRTDYQHSVMPYSALALAELDSLRAELDLPVVHFGTGTAEILDLMREAGASVIGVDYRIGLDEAYRRLQARRREQAQPLRALQGNIDPAYLNAGWPALEAHTRAVLAAGECAPGHVVNLGHGVPPSTDPEVLTELVSFIHSISVGVRSAEDSQGVVLPHE
ncbi:uroporphyrinogen decarboxylase [Auritidibacter ignavus]|uniref:uroporphyrinogen decarboxylase n=1 Tax=Auritidibacter ignavus TaxID=678932 RepID=UPI00244CD9D8|nr:uroporphyrinogen decarboxylase [Auritidibacter ignavus]WGH83941.1 uroporphyrinogen decarboxylase [Auritidibacter ignavus]